MKQYHDFKVYFYFKDDIKTKALYFPNYTLQELFKEVYGKFRMYYKYLDDVCVTMDNKCLLYDLYPVNKTGIMMRHNQATYAKAYLTKIRN